jgi:hypothetical protein
MRRHATVTSTTVERLVPGDQIRTPQGQLIRVRRFLPHETDRQAGYLETELGLLQVQRGMQVQLVPGGQKGPSVQQELPGPGSNTGGNFPGLPAAGQGPGGQGPAQPQGSGQAGPCPRCGNTLRIQGNQSICSQCGYHGAAQVSPIGMQPGIEHSLLQKTKPGHQDPGRYQLMASQRTAVARHADAVLRYLDEH